MVSVRNTVPPRGLTLILGRARAGDEGARDELVALVYDELHRGRLAACNVHPGLVVTIEVPMASPHDADAIA